MWPTSQVPMAHQHVLLLPNLGTSIWAHFCRNFVRFKSQEVTSRQWTVALSPWCGQPSCSSGSHWILFQSQGACLGPRILHALGYQGQDGESSHSVFIMKWSDILLRIYKIILLWFNIINQALFSPLCIYFPHLIPTVRILLSSSSPLFSSHGQTADKWKSPDLNLEPRFRGLHSSILTAMLREFR